MFYFRMFLKVAFLLFCATVAYYFISISEPSHDQLIWFISYTIVIMVFLSLSFFLPKSLSPSKSASSITIHTLSVIADAVIALLFTFYLMGWCLGVTTDSTKVGWMFIKVIPVCLIVFFMCRKELWWILFIIALFMSMAWPN